MVSHPKICVSILRPDIRTWLVRDGATYLVGGQETRRGSSAADSGLAEGSGADGGASEEGHFVLEVVEVQVRVQVGNGGQV